MTTKWVAGAAAMAGAVLLGLAQVSAQVTTLEADLQRAKQREAVSGDCKSSLADYTRIAEQGARTNRPIAAEALLHAAMCHDQLKDGKAQQFYARVAGEFKESPQAREANRWLAAVRGSAPSKGLVWTKPAGLAIVNVSPDGRYVLYQRGTDSDGLTTTFSTGAGAGSLGVHDLTTDTDHPLPTPKEAGTRVFAGGRAAWSRDSRQIAYTSAASQPAGTGQGRQLRVVEFRADGSGSNRAVLDNPDLRDMSAYDWAPDGQTIAVTLSRVDGTRQIGLVRIVDGSLRVLKTLGWRGADALTFSPDGRFLAFGLPAQDSNRTHVAVLAVDGSRDVPILRGQEDDSPLGWSSNGQELYFVRKHGEQDQLWTVAFNANAAPAQPRLVRELGILNDKANLTLSGALYVYDQPKQAATLQSASFNLATGVLTSRLNDAGALLGSIASEDLTSPLRFSPDGRLVAYRHRVRRASEVVTIRNIATGLAREFQPGIQVGYGGMVWSPDSRFLTMSGTDFDGRHHGIFRLDAETGAVAPIVLTTSGDELVTEYVDQPWSADAAKFYYLRIFEGGGKGRVLVERDLASGEERELMPRGAWAISLASDKEHLYYYDVSKPDNVLLERAVASGAEREIVKGVNGISLSPDGRFLATTVRSGTRGRSALIVDLKASQEVLRLDAFKALAWAPDSQAILMGKAVGVAGQPDFLFRAEFWWVPMGGGAPHRLLESHAIPDERLAFSAIGPDGRFIVFQNTSLMPLPPVEVWRFENFIAVAGQAR